jgi:hypothetical protein
MSLKENKEEDLVLSSFFLVLPGSVVIMVCLFLYVMKDKIRYCPIPYAITEMIINSATIISEAADCAPRRSEIFSRAVSTISTAITITAIIKIALLSTLGDDESMFLMKIPSSQPPL